jgi:hypothetical protein
VPDKVKTVSKEQCADISNILSKLKIGGDQDPKNERQGSSNSTH